VRRAPRGLGRLARDPRVLTRRPSRRLLSYHVRADLVAASGAIDALDIEGEQRALLTAELLRTALEHVTREGADPEVSVAGCALQETRIRLGLERTYRALAAVAGSPDERVRLVDEANRVRPRTWR